MTDLLCKSDLRWLEYLAQHAPAVLQDSWSGKTAIGTNRQGNVHASGASKLVGSVKLMQSCRKKSNFWGRTGFDTIGMLPTAIRGSILFSLKMYAKN